VCPIGNAFALTGFANRPPYDEIDPSSLIPDGPYSVGGNHFSNGATWIEQFARPLGLGGSVRPAFASSSLQATNYAVGGARATDDGNNVNMADQVAVFLKDFGGLAPSYALYVIDFGGNDVRDALLDPNNAEAIILAALTSLNTNLELLYKAGARLFLIVNVADIGKIPSILIANQFFPGTAARATKLAADFNSALANLPVFTLPGVEIANLDVFGTVDALLADHEAFGLTDVTHACITPNIPPFSCKKPDQFLFWDGIHPTTVHAIFAEKAVDVLGK
jgi:phospholipase/lecithinase/hemolysin